MNWHRYCMEELIFKVNELCPENAVPVVGAEIFGVSRGWTSDGGPSLLTS